jgi:hypothetical protein
MLLPPELNPHQNPSTGLALAAEHVTSSEKELQTAKENYNCVLRSWRGERARDLEGLERRRAACFGGVVASVVRAYKESVATMENGTMQECQEVLSTSALKVILYYMNLLEAVLKW